MRYFLFVTLFLISFLSGCERPTENVPDDGLPPAVPTGLFVRFAQDGEILIQWNYNNDPDFRNYNIYRAVNKTGFQKIFSTSNDYYYDDSLNYADMYYYKITAVDNGGRESAFTDSVFGVPANKYPPEKPGRNMFTAAGVNENNRPAVKLFWEPNDDGDISHYNIYRDSVSLTFTADSTNLIGSSVLPSFKDTLRLSYYKKYFYKVRAVDNGGLLSIESNPVSDMILEAPRLIFPLNESRISYFPDFIIQALAVPSRYKVIVQTNPYIGEFWSKEFTTSTVNDTLRISFNPTYIEPNITYYWRVAAFTGNSRDPNSVSDLYQFILKP